MKVPSMTCEGCDAGSFDLDRRAEQSFFVGHPAARFANKLWFLNVLNVGVEILFQQFFDLAKCFFCHLGTERIQPKERNIDECHLQTWTFNDDWLARGAMKAVLARCVKQANYSPLIFLFRNAKITSENVAFLSSDDFFDYPRRLHSSQLQIQPLELF